VRFFRIPSFTGIEAHRDDADRGSLRVVEGCLPYGPGGLRSGPVWKKVGEVSSLSNLDENQLYGADDGKGNSAMFVSRMNEVHELAIVSTENTKLESFGTNYLIVDPVEMYQEGKAVLAPVGNQLYSFGDGDGEAVFVGKQSKGVFPDEELYSYEWSKFPNCKFFVQGPKKTIYAAGNPDQPLRVYISEPASKTSPIKDSPYSTEEPVIDAYGGLLSVVDILATNATEITALSSRGDQVVVHTNKGCHLLYAPTSDQAETGYRVEQAPATNFSAAVSSQVVAGETGSMSFWLGHDGQIYKDESASRGAEDVKNYADPAQVSWKSKSVWEKELHYDLRDSFAAYDRQSGMYWIYVLAPEYLDNIDDGIPGMVVNLEALPERPGIVTNLNALTGLPGQVTDLVANPLAPGNILDLKSLPIRPGTVTDLDIVLRIPSFVTDLVALPPIPGSVIIDAKPIVPGDIDDLEAEPIIPGDIPNLDTKPVLPGDAESLETLPVRPGIVTDLKIARRPAEVTNLEAEPRLPGAVTIVANPVIPGDVTSLNTEPREPGSVGNLNSLPVKPGSVSSVTSSPSTPSTTGTVVANPAIPGNVGTLDTKPVAPGTVTDLEIELTQLGKPELTLSVPGYMNPEQSNFSADWTPVENATYPQGYELQFDKYQSGQNYFDPPDEEYTPDASPMNFTDLEYYKMYAVRVRAVGHGRFTTGPWSDVKTFQTPRQKLAVPENLNAFYSVFNEDPSKDVTVTWTHNQLADVHQLQISTISDFSTLVINHTQTSGPALFIEEEPDSLLTPETNYYVRIRCSGGNYETSDWSETVQYRTANEIPAPHTVTNLEKTVIKPGSVTGLDAEKEMPEPDMTYAYDDAFKATNNLFVSDYAGLQAKGWAWTLNQYASFAPATNATGLDATGTYNKSGHEPMNTYFPRGGVTTRGINFAGHSSSTYHMNWSNVKYRGLRDADDLGSFKTPGDNYVNYRWADTPQGVFPSWTVDAWSRNNRYYDSFPVKVWIFYDPNGTYQGGRAGYVAIWGQTTNDSGQFIVKRTNNWLYMGRILRKADNYDDALVPNNPFGTYYLYENGNYMTVHVGTVPMDGGVSTHTPNGHARFQVPGATLNVNCKNGNPV